MVVCVADIGLLWVYVCGRLARKPTGRGNLVAEAECLRTKVWRATHNQNGQPCQWMWIVFEGPEGCYPVLVLACQVVDGDVRARNAAVQCFALALAGIRMPFGHRNPIQETCGFGHKFGQSEARKQGRFRRSGLCIISKLFQYTFKLATS